MFSLSSANPFNLVTSKILSFGKAIKGEGSNEQFQLLVYRKPDIFIRQQKQWDAIINLPVFAIKCEQIAVVLEFKRVVWRKYIADDLSNLILSYIDWLVQHYPKSLYRHLR